MPSRQTNDTRNFIVSNIIRFITADNFKTLVFLAFIVFSSHFFHFQNFGLYEDDYASVQALNCSSSDLINFTKQSFQGWPQGRPLHFLLIPSLMCIGFRTAGLSTIYILAFMIVTINAFLFYLLLKRVASEIVAVTGALAFTLFPADTTQILLRHAFGLQTSLLFFLIAAHCFLSGRKILSYLLILCSLLTYESVFFVFLAIPLLRKKWSSSLVIELIGHAMVMFGIAVSVYLVRRWMSDSRVFEMGTDVLPLIKVVLQAILIGMQTSMGRFVATPFLMVDILRVSSNPFEIVALMSVGLVVLFHRFWKLEAAQLSGESEERVVLPLTELSLKISPAVLESLKLIFIAVVMLCLAYVVSFTPPHFPPVVWHGRLTSVHLAATIGGAILFSAIASIFVLILTTARLKNLAAFTLALYLSVLIGYRVVIQQDFEKSWETQRWLWTNIVNNSQDMTNGTVILIRFDELPAPNFIESSSWADPLILPYIYRFPQEWDNPPKLLAIGSWGAWWPPITPLAEGRWSVTWAGWNYTLQDSNVIAFKISGRQMLRLQGSITLDGQTIHLKPSQPEIRPTWEKGPLYDLLIFETLLQ